MHRLWRRDRCSAVPEGHRPQIQFPEVNPMKTLKSWVALALALFMLAPASVLASSHREAPITALDRTADITDWYAFVSYDNPKNVTFILNVDPFLEPANGPNYFPFDPNVLYEMKIDNNQDGVEDITFQFRFATEIRQPNLFTGFVGGIAGIPPITSLRSDAIRRSFECGSADYAELPGVVQPGNLQPGQQRECMGGHGRRPFLHRLGSGL
jgi:hypothetical protein